MKHVDLFSGIGGFSLACDWLGIETICFCEMDKFCQKVLTKHWPDVPIVEDVNNVEEIKRVVANSQSGNARRTAGAVSQSDELQTEERPQGRDAEFSDTNRIRFTTNTKNLGHERCGGTWNGREGFKDSIILTAGFPCQPFSNAGRKRGADDHRYLWPQTLAVIESIKPDYVLLENVTGLINMVFPDSESGVASQASFLGDPNDEIADYRTICGGIERDLRQAGYETVWLVIPACSLRAPHRRDRVWIVAYSLNNNDRWKRGQIREPHEISGINRKTLGAREFSGASGISPHASEQGLQGEQQPGCDKEGTESRNKQPAGLSGTIPGWQENWYEVATRFCRIHDGVPNRVDRLKALGNAIVPAVAYQVIKSLVQKGGYQTSPLNSEEKVESFINMKDAPF